MMKPLGLAPTPAVNRSFFYILILAGLSALFAPVTAAQEQSGGPNEEVLRACLQAAEAGDSLDQTAAEAVELCKRALGELEKARAYDGEAKAHAERREAAPAEIPRLRARLDAETKAAGKKRAPRKNISLDNLEKMLREAKAELVAGEAALTGINASLELRDRRPAEARDRIIAADRAKSARAAELVALPQGADVSRVDAARKWLLEAQIHALDAEIGMLDQELLSHSDTVEWLQARRNLAAARVQTRSERVRELEDLANKKRLDEAEAVRSEVMAANEDLRDKHPTARALAESNVALGESLRARALDLESAAAGDEAARANARRITEELNTTKQKLEVAGLSQGLGRVLVEQRRELPALPALRKEAAGVERLIAEAGLQKIQYEERRRALRDLDLYVAGLSEGVAQADADALREELRDLAATQRELLERAIATEAAYLRALGEIDLAHRELINVVEDYDSYLAKRLLWIRSVRPIGLPFFEDMLRETARVLHPVGWLGVVTDLYRQFLARPFITSAMFILIGAVLMRRRFLAAAVATAENTRKIIRSDSFWLTLQCLGWTLLAALPLPLLLHYVAWLLLSDPAGAEFTHAVAGGLGAMGYQLIFLLFFADSAVRGGLVEKHFRWKAEVASKIGREFKLLMAFLLPATFITAHGFALDKSGFGGGLGLLAALTLTAAVAVFIYRVFTPDGGILRPYLATHPNSFLARYRALWLSVSLLGMGAMLLSALAGYIFTVHTLVGSLIVSLWVVYSLILLRGLVVRWLLVMRMRLAFQVAAERREATRLSRMKTRAAETKPAADLHIEVSEPETDLATLNSDSRKLIDTAALILVAVALWFIWVPLTPALGVLEDVELWGRTAVTAGVEHRVPVTLADLGLVIIIGAVTLSAARGLPALLEFILRERTTVTRGGIFTAKTLLRYTLFALGFIVILNILGGSWGQIQWLVAALGVGIGFGLQEIVANFISGLIILFERPIRVGDTVTVGDVHGVVSRIEIRATTITNWDNQELLVPNKEFITGRLLNWSLSDPIIRIEVPVGIAYGSDVAKAMAILKQIAAEHPAVLAEPAPMITFESFGDNALGLFLRVFIPSIDYKLLAVSELHQTINDKFNEAGIVIAFPQRDIHLEQTQPLEVRVTRDDAKRRGKA